ncbi:thyrotropin-releasing hormone-degrading ectoenzyme-like [Ruditapes philippinarum]|uniref:thyrotropin-releasing hormone-degrading ectoenzyme-like n=1 Tax=Ruditapes philippinarum TaxID=129788 RepID=UPI00295B7F39|nr:thyrotropin-releasing hormone-degrading ectoenzyme-like [Ruditapes philippinarum]
MKLGIFVLLVKFMTLALCQENQEERIKNGQDVTGGDFSFAVKLQLNNKHVCNGILVDSKWVVTLKKCVDKKKVSQYRVHMSSSQSKGIEVMREVNKLEVPDKKNNDVIMLELNKEVDESKDKVTALDRFSTSKLDKKMTNCKAVGFTENGKRQSEVAVSLKWNKCKGKGTLCFGTKTGSVCKVDNGSPVVCKYQSKWYLTGSSFVNKKCSNKNIKGFRLSYYSSAIKKVVKDSEVIGCGTAPNIDNANVLLSNSSTDIGARADVSCFQGYTSNKTVLNCLESRKWETTECTAIESEDYVVRLPLDFDPLLYAIELKPDIYNNVEPEEFSFTGSVTIKLNCLSDTSIITLNINRLSIEGPIVVNLEGSSENLYQKHVIEKELQFLYILTNQYLKAGGKYVLSINKFDGFLGATSDGFFYAYDEEDGNKVYFAATQFQPISARKAFPCFDEPAIKSRYDITLVRKKSVSSLSNMPLSNSTNRANGWIADTFERTPKMSVYLLAFFVGNHEHLEKTTANGVIFRTWSKPSAINKTTYALDVGVKMQEFFADYFAVSYPLPKQDNIAISNYQSGGMENWGLIVYADNLMLVDLDKDSLKSIETAASIVSHEVAHTWVGNLVTTHWWDDIWLNEGFARFYQYTGVDFAHPDWNMWDKFIKDILHSVLLVDGNPRWTHPLHNPVYKPKDINKNIFGLIPYNKGAAVIRMLSFMVGQNTFQNGMKRYIKDNSYKAVTNDDLYSVMEEQAKADGRSITNIKEIMDTWVLQMTYPLVNVEFTVQGR